MEHSILVVDDDVDITSNVRDILTEFGYRTDVAHDGASALKLVRKKTYDVALLDFKMPDMDGATLFEKIREIQPSLVAIMVTAYAGSDGVQRARDAGTWQVLRKPVDLPQLLGLIKEATQKPVVLIVDDDNDFCENLWQILLEKGYRAAIANNQQQAQSLLEVQQFDVVLLDLLLGESLSTDVFQSLRKLSRQPATMVITGDRSKSEAAEQMIEQGADCLHFKPLDMQSLLEKLDSLVQG